MLMSGRMEVRTFGGISVLSDGERAPSHGARSADALLALLATHSAPLVRSEVAELLWPGRSEVTSQGNLRAAVHRLKRSLGTSLESTRHSVALGAGVSVDARDFEEFARNRRMAEATALYGGEFAKGLYLDGSPAFEQWLVEAREHYRNLAVAAYQERLTLAVAQADTAQIPELAETLLTIEPLHEPTVRILMRSLTAEGRRAAALARFERFKATLASDLDLSPDTETEALARTLRDGEAPVAVHPVTAVDGGRHPLDTTGATPFVGRQSELAAVRSRLLSADCRLVTITGPGGFGKTRLALEAAASIQDRFADGAAVVMLAGVDAAESIMPTVARSLGLGLDLSGGAAKKVTTYLRDKRSLLVLDNLEQVESAADVITDLLRAARGVKVLVTSRERLYLSEEWLIPIGGLSLAEDAPELFHQLALRHDPSHDRQRDDGDVREICRLLSGMPLAVELAAAWLDTLTCRGIADELQRGTLALTATRSHLPERHRDMARLLAHSIGLLTPRLQGLLASLSVFRGGFRLEEARQVVNAELDDLRELVVKSHLHHSAGRFSMHEVARRFAADRLRDAHDEDAVGARHARAYLALAEQGRLQVFGSQQTEWARLIDAESDNFRAALTWSFERGTRALALQLVSALAWAWRYSNNIDELDPWLRRASSFTDLETSDTAELSYHLGLNAWRRGEYKRSETLMEESLRLYASLGDEGRWGVGIATHALGMSAHFQGRYHDAETAFRSAIAAFSDLGADWWIGLGEGWLAKTAMMLGDRDTATSANDRSIRIFADLGNPTGLGLFLSTRAQLRLDAGDLVGARAASEDALRYLQELTYSHPLGEVYRLLGTIERLEGRHARADHNFRQGYRLYRELGLEELAESLRVEAGGGPAVLN